MSAIQLLEVQFCFFVFVSVCFLLFCEYKRQTSDLAQLGRAWKRYERYVEANKSYFLELYKLALSVSFGVAAENQISSAATSGNGKADEVVSAIKGLVVALTSSAEAKTPAAKETEEETK